MDNITNAVNQEIIKRLKIQLRDVNRNIREFNTEEMETSDKFRELISEQMKLKARIKSLE